MPQDGAEKQDCELRAVERWLRYNLSHSPAGALTLLGDDLYCHQPFCALVLELRQHFAFTCKPDSHPTLYQEIELLSKAGGVAEVSQRRWNGQRYEFWRYRYAIRLPLRADIKPLYVNWCEVTITAEATGQLLYCDAWATDHALTESGLHEFVVARAPAGKARTRTTTSSRTTTTTWSITSATASNTWRWCSSCSTCWPSCFTPRSTCATNSTAACEPNSLPARLSSTMYEP